MAIDPDAPDAGKIYWANEGFPDKISFANLDNTGGGNLSTIGATVENPVGVAIDPDAGKIYWANAGNNTISFASLNGTGGGDQISTDGATLSTPIFPALLRAPSGTGAPAISGGSSLDSTPTCSEGSWATDLLGSFLYRAPRSFAFQWSLDGADIAGAIESTYTLDENGSYSCRVSASNEAGSAAQTSAATEVSSKKFSFTNVALNKNQGTAKLTVEIPGAGKLKLKKANKLKSVKKIPSNAGKVKLKAKPKGDLKRKLNQKGKATVTVTVAYKPSGGGSKTKSKKVKLKQK